MKGTKARYSPDKDEDIRARYMISSLESGSGRECVASEIGGASDPRTRCQREMPDVGKPPQAPDRQHEREGRS